MNAVAGKAGLSHSMVSRVESELRKPTLFLSRAQRRVRLDATFSLEGQLWKAPTHLRGQLIQVRFNPFDWRRVEIWREDKYVGPARRCDKQLNSKTYLNPEYDRPDKSS